MKHFYPTLSVSLLTKSILLSAFFLCAFYSPKAQVFYASLSGLNESPSNNSTGTGKAIVTIDAVAKTMRVQVTFSGLLGLTTASHIHAATPVPLTGTAGVATQLPTFLGFPLGVTSGTYDHTFDMTQASSYNPAFITANGGTPLSAFAGLLAAITAGKSYLNIHSTVFPGGEIRGFLLPCPTITVSIPDAFALAQGVLPNTVYPAYAPASSLTLQANVNGGAGPYTYNWSNGTHTSAVTVTPTGTTTYSVSVHDQNGCSGSATKTIAIMDVSSGKKGDKIDVCHQGRNTLSIAVAAVDAHLNHGDMLGSCSEAGQSVTVRGVVLEEYVENFSVKTFSNPSPNYFELQITGKADNLVQLKVYDLLGKVVETRPSLQTNQTLRIGTSYRPGIYVVQITQGAQTKTLKLIKTK